MSETKVKEIAPGVYKEGNEFVFDPVKVAVEGTRKGIEIINQTVENRNSYFDEVLVKKLHGAVLYYLPGVAGHYRLEEDVRLGDRRLIKGPELQDRMYQFGTWLKGETETLKDQHENLLGAVRLASEAHYGLVSPQLHPFDDGNGRVARLLTNGILMMNTHELMFYGFKILPVPLIRHIVGKEDPYIKILEEVNEIGQLDQLDLYVATLWVQNIQQLLEAYKFRFMDNGHGKTKGDEKLVAKFESRAAKLQAFIGEKRQGKVKEAHLVPDYFATSHVQLEHA